MGARCVRPQQGQGATAITLPAKRSSIGFLSAAEPVRLLRRTRAVAGFLAGHPPRAVAFARSRSGLPSRASDGMRSDTMNHEP